MHVSAPDLLAGTGYNLFPGPGNFSTVWNSGILSPVVGMASVSSTTEATITCLYHSYLNAVGRQRRW